MIGLRCKSSSGTFANLSRPNARRHIEWQLRALIGASSATFYCAASRDFPPLYLKAMWSINIRNLLTSPLTIAEFAVALMVMSLIRLAIGVVPGRAHRSNAYAARY